MALKTLARVVVCGVLVARAPIASALSVAVELDQSAGYSTEDVAAAHTKLRAFGDLLPSIRFNVTGTWGKQSEESDAFAAAYPYTEHPVVLDAYAERTFRPAGRLFGVRVGRYRTPFGISSESDQGYVGFERNPLIRYDDFFALSSTFFEHGADVMFGSPRASLEASLGAPADVGEHTRAAGLDTVLRGQFVAGSLIVGASYIDTRPHLARDDDDGASPLPADIGGVDLETHDVSPGRATFGGIDLRWMRDGVQLRGEYIAGRPFDGARTHGGYADLIVHRPFMGPITAALRAERIRHTDAGALMLQGERYTAATRVRLPRGFAAHLEIVRNSRALPGRRVTAADVALSYSVRLE
jgi:hypothetical protein